MRLHRICTVSFSPTGNTEKVVRTLGEALAAALSLPLNAIPFTKLSERGEIHSFDAGTLLIAGTPTYAGRMPNKIAPDFAARLRGNGAAGVAVVTFGNRSYDNALAEFCALLTKNGFHVAAAGAFVGRHAFTDALAEGRPNGEDLEEVRAFALGIAEKLQGAEEWPPIAVPGLPDGPYYVPKGKDGQDAKFLKAKPQTDLSQCSGCGACARWCPMGAIDKENPASVPGTCIKCHACVRRCTRRAKFFDDPAFLSHVAMLEKNFKTPQENETFL